MPACAASVPSATVPATAAQYVGAAILVGGFGPGRVLPRTVAVIIHRIPIRTQLPGIAVHVEQSPIVGLESSDGGRKGKAVIPRHFAIGKLVGRPCLPDGFVPEVGNSLQRTFFTAARPARRR